eukprot:GEMP01074655.1.p1 GENE.GEMP01074655.1~~GEMP01074655.1.p1  ORF type:complete len:340 (+),score=59.25 GEMP01074655.1:90-1109(+)
MVLRALSFACTWADAYHTRTLGNADAYHTSPTGEPGTMDDRVDFSSHVDARSAISPWHGIPFKSKDGFYHFVCEIPKGATEKMEEIDGNPIKQDTKKYANGTEYVRYITYGGGALANYGYLTQTWENPNVTHDNHFGTLGQGVPGDGDPVGVLVLDDAPCKIGDVFTVWLLGGLALLGDSNERDWKLLAARQGQLKPSDYEEQVAAVREWFTSSKGNDTDGNPMHEVFVEINAEDADKVALDTHEQWAAQTHERRDAPKSTDDPDNRDYVIYGFTLSPHCDVSLLYRVIMQCIMGGNKSNQKALKFQGAKKPTWWFFLMPVDCHCSLREGRLQIHSLRT